MNTDLQRQLDPLGPVMYAELLIEGNILIIAGFFAILIVVRSAST